MRTRMALGLESLYTLLLGMLLALQAHIPDLGIPFLTVVLVLVFILGIPHGAADALIFYHLHQPRGLIAWITFGGLYLFAAGLVVITWMLSPWLFIGYLFVISAIHFGEDLEGKVGLNLRIAYGASIIFAPTFLWKQELVLIFKALGGGTHGPDFVQLGECVEGIALVSLFLVVLSNRSYWRIPLIRQLALPLVTLVFLKPLVGFALYFCLWHSRLHLTRLWQENILDRSRRSLLYLGLPVALTGVMVFGALFCGQAIDSGALYQILFVGLGALTLPHFVMVLKLSPRELEDPPLPGAHFNSRK